MQSKQFFDSPNCQADSSDDLKVEALIVQLKEGVQKMSWPQIAEAVNQATGEKRRTHSQCRRIYIKYLQGTVSGSEQARWSFEQAEKICETYIKEGPDWQIIFAMVPNKSRQIVKNHIKSAFRSLLMNINKEIKVKLYKIKYNSLKRFLVITDPQYKIKCDEEELQQFQKTRHLLIKSALLAPFLSNTQQTHKQITDGLHEFNRKFRHLNMRNFSYIRSSLASQSIKSSKKNNSKNVKKNLIEKLNPVVKTKNQQASKEKSEIFFVSCQGQNSGRVEENVSDRSEHKETGSENCQYEVKKQEPFNHEIRDNIPYQQFLYPNYPIFNCYPYYPFFQYKIFPYSTQTPFN